MSIIIIIRQVKVPGMPRIFIFLLYNVVPSLLLLLLLLLPVGDAFSVQSVVRRRCRGWQQHVYGDDGNDNTVRGVGSGGGVGVVLMMASSGFPPPMMDGGGMGSGRSQQQQGQSFNANNPPGGAFSVPNAGNTAGVGGQQQQRGQGGLGAIASGVSTPMDRYNDRPSARRPGGFYGSGGGGGPNLFRQERGGPGGGGPSSSTDRRMGPGDGRPNNLRFEERDYGEYVTNLRRSGGPPPPPPLPMIGERGDIMDYRALEEEVQRLRTENALLKRSCQDLMNNMNELSNRLFDVDECLKKVANVFPKEEEMESLEWLLRR